jgi:hypothetical protein
VPSSDYGGLMPFLFYIGGLTPSFSAVTKAAVRLPSGCLRANTNTVVPGFNRLASPGP